MSKNLQAESKADTKRLNRIPVIFGIMLVTIILFVIMISMYSKSQNQKKDTDSLVNIFSSKNTAEDLVKHYNFIPEDNILVEQEDIKEIENNKEPEVIIKEVPVVVNNIDNEYELELKRLELIRQRQFESAITSDITHNINNLKSSNYSLPFTNNNSSILDEIDNQIMMLEELANADTKYIYDNYMNELENNRNKYIENTSSNLSFNSATENSDREFKRASRSLDRNNTRNQLEDFDGDNSRWKRETELDLPEKYQIRAGTVIPALMITGINSELPSQIICQVSENVYDTATGKYNLIPQGTKVIGSYSSSILFGQSRVFVVWQRLVFPDGSAMDIGANPGTTGEGYAGLKDKVNNHYLRIFGSAFMMSAILAGIDMTQNNVTSGSDNNRQRMGDALSEALGNTFGGVIAEMVQKNLNIAPTLVIRAGFRLNVMLVNDITFNNQYKPFNYLKSSK